MAKKDVVTDKEIVKDLITAHKNPPNKPGSKYDLTFFYYLVAFMLLIIELKHPKFILWVLIALIIVGAIGSIVYKIRLTHLKKTFSISNYDITVMTVDCIRDEYYTYRRKTSTYNVYNYIIRFKNGKEWNIPVLLYRWSERHATYGPELYKNTHAGDTFIVVTKKSDSKIIMAYNTDIFEYKK